MRKCGPKYFPCFRGHVSFAHAGKAIQLPISTGTRNFPAAIPGLFSSQLPEAAKMLTAVCQYQRDEEPSAKWFPNARNGKRLLITNASGILPTESMSRSRDGADTFIPAQKQKREPQAPVKLPEIMADFKSASDNPAVQARMILQSPDFLDKALKNGSKAGHGAFQPVQLHRHGIEHGNWKPGFPQAPKAVGKFHSLNEQKIAAQKRMRV